MDQQPNNTVPSLEEWNKLLKAFPFQQENINKLIANYLVREGYKEAVETFIQESNVHPTISLHSLEARQQICETIRYGNALEAVHLMGELFPGLLETDHLLKFLLLQLHLLETIRAGRVEDALFFAQKLPLEVAEHTPEVTDEIQRTLSLLIYDDPLKCPFGALLEQSHRDKVARAFNEKIFKWTNEGLPSTGVNHLLKMMVWCQDELSKGKVQFIKMKNLATASLE